MKGWEAYDRCNLVGVKRSNSSKDDNGIYYAGIWQELVLSDENDKALKWAEGLF